MNVEICTYKHGRLIYFPGDPYMGRFLAQYGQYSEGEIELFSQILQPQDVVIEAGANIGCHTVPLAKMCSVVFAVEPQIPLFHALCGNLALNAVFNVLPLNIAVGAENGVCVVPVVDYQASGINFGGISMRPPGAEGRQVSMQTLDTLVSQVTNLKLIKADVEGMEWDVLYGAQRLISEHRPYLYLEDDREDKRERLHALLHDLGYRVHRHCPPYVIDHPELVSLNLLCIPEEKEGVLKP
jgi:FkbM family methyltransferase